MLTNGALVQGEFGGEVRIGAELGSGGQGAVYQGIDASGRTVAVKWYYDTYQTKEMRAAIKELVVRKAPSHHFLWPEDIVTHGSDYGYLMQLYPPDFVTIPKLMKRRVDITFAELVRAACQTVSAFKALQSQGLFYCDISANNLRIQPNTGDILICDNDNVRAGKSLDVAFGTPRYMAPEVARGDAEPSALTDSFSMAVLLFYLLMNDHPLDGATVNRIKVLNLAAMRKVYGTDPVFAFDPNDDTNRPESGVQRNSPVFWELYPRPIKDVFTKVFTAGLKDPGARPSFSEWQRALSALEDSVLPCPSCGKQNFFDVEVGPRPCWSCRVEVGMPLRLVLEGRRSVVLNATTQLYRHHLSRLSGDPGNRGAAVAAVSKHPTQDVWGLRNLTNGAWYATGPDGTAHIVDPGRSLTIRSGTRVNFGEVSAEFA